MDREFFKDHVIFTYRQLSMLIFGLCFAAVGLVMYIYGSPTSPIYDTVVFMIGLGFLIGFGFSTNRYLRVLKARKLSFKYEADHVKLPG